MRMLIEHSEELVDYRNLFPLERLDHVLERDVFRPALDHIILVLKHTLCKEINNLTELF
jgi:hypothetical protein